MKNKVIERLTISRATLLEVVVAAFLLGICASLSASIIYDSLKSKPYFLLLLIIALSVVCMLFLFKKLWSARKASIDIDGFLIYSDKSNSIVSVPRYDLSEEVCDYLSSAFSENEALKRQWDSQPIANLYKRDVDRQYKASMSLIQEAIEYYVLESLSTHLTDYFNKEKYDDSELKYFQRNDVPSVLFTNRFMELFSSPMENRLPFMDGEGVSEGTVVMSVGKNGERYSRFDLVLPKDAKIFRDNDSVVIETSKFKLKLSASFDGYGYVTPVAFEKHYLGMESFRDSLAFKVGFRAEVDFKWLSTVSPTKWDYHEWLDGFFESIEKEMSADKFFEKISWETVSTMIQCKQIMPNKQFKSDS
ncbi:hypothetical protein M2G95_21395 [Vibrio vulnificus]|uniref:hypothetical protein n=1 Tax=Vibrio vulnificus TaxID=672 RepID=UPI001A2E9A37|nr:hypothetical protein [Vibrio vulnificus]EHU5198709.1 hypothetical protein [Vibrio vulnificus]MCU8124810.1 hypothetical protein [Vibrio vulnificus]MCU8304526.1 hypothetical protein [Vibrio vulnificus]MDK2640190.1 hypothetical protein [Vibrio vulnificus]MDK2648969.1 hypothetical protein [Vibrio vulnificus]